MHTKDYTKIQELLTQWLNDYSLKIKSESDEVWLANKLKKDTIMYAVIWYTIIVQEICLLKDYGSISLYNNI